MTRARLSRNRYVDTSGRQLDAALYNTIMMLPDLNQLFVT